MRALRFFRPWPSSPRSARSLCTAAPAWWQRGWPRQRIGSVAEAELLAPLAELLMPHMPIAELFRSFPSPKGWGGNYLEPDLAAYGVLKDANAALFVEYDGYWRHGEKEGMARDRMKNAALLKYAPKGSCVIRISHTISRPLQNSVLFVRVEAWRSGCPGLVTQIRRDILKQTIRGLSQTLHHEIVERLQLQTEGGGAGLSSSSTDFINTTISAGQGNTIIEISSFLETEGFGKKNIDLMLEKSIGPGMSIEKKLQPKLRWLLNFGLTNGQAAKAVATFPPILGLSLEQNLNPTVQWFLELGLSKSQVAKAVATNPQILGLSLEQNLKPTMQWFSDLGLTKSQCVKAVCTFPPILWYSIEKNLKPTVQWLLDLGLRKSQVAKAVATFPQLLGLSIEKNLKPTVQWFSDLGLTKSQCVKAVATFPQILGLSMEQNLKPTVQWLLDFGLTESQVAKAVASNPRILALSLEQNLKPTVQWLSDLGLTDSQVAKAVATCPQLICLSIEKNLKPTVQWLLDFGLTESQLAKTAATFPQILAFSIAKNLSAKTLLLKDFFATKGAVELVAKWPQLLGYSYQRLTTRLKILAEQNKTQQLITAMSLTEEVFQRRFQHGPKKSEGLPHVF